MKIVFGLNIILRLIVIDEKVGYEDVLYINVHNIKKSLTESSTVVTLYCDYHGERIYFDNFGQIADMNKRKLLALRNITAILS